MQLLRNLFSRHFYRQVSFWILFVIASYSAAGFWLAPYLINKIAVEQVQQRLGWQAQIAKVEVNPYKLDLNIEEFAIYDEQQKEVLGFKRFYINFTLRSLFEWALTFQEIELLDPRVDLTIDKDGTNNFVLALQKHAVEEQQPVQQETSGEMFPLLFDKIRVDNGGVKVHNNLPKTAVLHQVKPITFDLQNFSTRLNEDGQYQLDIVLDTEQSLHWKGLVSLNPIRSKGNLDISGIRVHKFSPYFEDAVPYQLVNGLAAVKGGYEFAMTEAKPELKILNALIDINDLKFHSQAVQDDFLNIKHIHVGPTNFDLQAKKLSINEVIVEQLVFDMLRNKQGELPLLTALQSSSEKAATPQSTANQQVAATEQVKPIEQQPQTEASVEKQETSEATKQATTKPAKTEQTFAWSINKIELRENQVNWLDQQPAQPAEISVSNINLELKGLSQDLSKPLSLTTNYMVNDSQTNQVQGVITPVPFDFKANLKLDAINLKMAQPYVSEVAHVRLTKGRLFADLDLTLAQDKQGQMLTELAGGINVKAFNSRDKLLNKRFVGWQNLVISPMSIKLNPLAINIEKIELDEPYARMIITEQRSTNIAGLMVKQPEQAESKTAEQDKQPAAVLPIRIGEISLKEGAAYFADLSLRPQFGSGIEHMNGSIKGINSQSKTPAEVDIKGRIEDYGKMAVLGKFKPFANDLYTDIDVNFDKVELTTMTPYSGRYAGYVIDKGKLSLHLNYLIENRMLKGTNRLILDQFELGKAVDSKEAVNLPIKLALALFKDKNGVIDISLPTSGNLDDPSFKISGLILQALTNVITKAVSSPFSALAGLADGDPEKLSSVSFALGKTQLAAEQKANLKTLAELLVKRPNLVLEVRVKVDKQAETDVLKALHLQEELAESGADLNDPAQRLKAMENEYIARTSKQGLTQLQQQVKTELQAAAGNEVLDKQKAEQLYAKNYQDKLNEQLLATQSLASLELLNLAKKRVAAIKKELITVNKVPNAQIYALNPSLDGIAQDNQVKTEFNLSAE